MIVTKIINKFKHLWYHRSSDAYIGYLRSLGISIGTDVHIQFPNQIDITRPYLVSIGNHVFISQGFTLLTHDFTTSVFRNLYGEFLASSGSVQIGNNVYFAQKCTVMKGVTIGDNCIIGYGSVVTRNTPPNSVVVGCPARVVCTVDEYYKKRLSLYENEAFNIARCIKKRLGRKPVMDDFFEEFPLFVDGSEYERYKDRLPIDFQLCGGLEIWKRNHKAKFKDFESFLDAAGISD